MFLSSKRHTHRENKENEGFQSFPYPQLLSEEVERGCTYPGHCLVRGLLASFPTVVDLLHLGHMHVQGSIFRERLVARRRHLRGAPSEGYVLGICQAAGESRRWSGGSGRWEGPKGLCGRGGGGLTAASSGIMSWRASDAICLSPSSQRNVY